MLGILTPFAVRLSPDLALLSLKAMLALRDATVSFFRLPTGDESVEPLCPEGLLILFFVDLDLDLLL